MLLRRTLLLTLLAFSVTLGFNSCSEQDTVEKTKTTDETDKKDSTTEVFLAPTEVQKKVAVLEDFTGVRCGYCPQGHKIAEQLLEDYGKQVIVIGVNAGGYARPAKGWANFTTPFGNALVGQSNVKGYPAGTVNRYMFPGKNGLSMGRGGWTKSAKIIMEQDAPVNIGAEASYDESTRELTIKVDLYYTDDVTEANNLNIALLQSGMVAKQSGGGKNYVHKHVLRDFITGQWGEEISSDQTSKGTRLSKTYTYTVPEHFNGLDIPPGGGAVKIEDCELAIFVANGRTDILNGYRLPIIQ